MLEVPCFSEAASAWPVIRRKRLEPARELHRCLDTRPTTVVVGLLGSPGPERSQHRRLTEPLREFVNNADGERVAT